MGGKAKADLTYDFNPADDNGYDRIGALDALISSYRSKLISIQGGGTVSGGGDDNGGGGDSGGGTPSSGIIICTFTSSGGNNSFFSINGNTSNSKGTVNVDGVTYSYCLKMESTTKIIFNIDRQMTLKLVFGLVSDPAASGKRVKIDGTNETISGSEGILTKTLSAGSHTIEKGDTLNLFYISLTE
jgi:pectate lyase